MSWLVETDILASTTKECSNPLLGRAIHKASNDQGASLPEKAMDLCLEAACELPVEEHFT
jgi:hypothetical protein